MGDISPSGVDGDADAQAPAGSPGPPILDVLPTVSSPAVPDEWVPVPHEPVRLPRQKPLRAIVVVGLTLTALGLSAWAIVALYATVGVADRDVLTVGLRAAEAIISADVDALRGLVPEETERKVGDAGWKAAESDLDRPKVTYGTPAWTAGSVRVAVRYEGRPLVLTVEPHGEDPLAVRVTLLDRDQRGIEGIVRLVRERGGLKVVYWTLGEESASYAPEDVGRTFAP